MLSLYRFLINLCDGLILSYLYTPSTTTHFFFQFFFQFESSHITLLHGYIAHLLPFQFYFILDIPIHTHNCSHISMAGGGEGGYPPPSSSISL